MKNALRSGLRRVGYDIVRYTDMPVRPFDVLRLVVDCRVAAGQRTRFVQIGANDGVSGDPIRDLVLKHRLCGIFVEPLPDLFARLRENYARHPGLLFEQCAIGDTDGEATIYRVQPSPDLPEWLHQIASFDRKHLTSEKFEVRNLERYVEPVSVPVLTFSSLLKKHGFDGCELLQVDTEGFDCKIITWVLQAGYRPAVINYEFIHARPDERVRCKELLAESGYSFVDVGRDTLAVLEQ